MTDEQQSQQQEDVVTLDLSKKGLKKVPKQEDAQCVRILILDDNELQKIDNIDSYLKIEKLSLSKNQLLRMYGVCRLHCLKELNLSFNGILTIEGLKELIHLQHLNLEGNNVKTIEHLQTNTKLETLNLSENNIASISDISFLKCLKQLNLHGNRLTHLRQCEKYLPNSLETLTLSKNNIPDLNEICTLSHLCNLNSIAINDNPCVQMISGSDGFDHRPFVLNWCMSVKVIDGFVVDPIESLKAEWLYSQGRGRQFRLGEQGSLAKYLSSVCPLTGKALENENERKLRLILSKAQQHQRQLQEEISENSINSSSSSPSTCRKKTASRIHSPRNVARFVNRQGSPDSMSSSYHGNTSINSLQSHSETIANANQLIQMTTSLIENFKNDNLLAQTLDGTLAFSSRNSCNSSVESTPRTMTPSLYSEQNSYPTGGPLAAASKMVPVPESLMSPDCCPQILPHKVATVPVVTQQPKVLKNKPESRMISSPKIRSPQMRRVERSPIASPKKLGNSNLKSCMASTDLGIRKKPCSSVNSVHISPPYGSATVSSDEDSDNFSVDKVRAIRNQVKLRTQQQKETAAALADKNTEASAIVIQKIWRGYRTRKVSEKMAEQILKKRTQEYIEKLTKDMEQTKAQLENEKKIQQLQMQAINALWKKVSTMQISTNSASNQDGEGSGPPSLISLDNSSTAVVTDLSRTCTMLTTQVQQLQGSMRDILNCLSMFCNLPQDNHLRKAFVSVLNEEEPKDSIETQTEIIAVHTPQIENFGTFPFKQRPSTLPLDNVDVDTTSDKQEPVIQSSSSQSNENEEESLSTSDKNDKPKDQSETSYGSEQLVV
ncbi:CEP97 family protein [Megaselia abdita]